MMPGMIMLWYGSTASIPSGWHLCDGAMGTPDLRGKYIRGAGGIYGVGGTGGSTTHFHTFTGDGHGHDLVEGNSIINSSPAGDWNHQTSVVPASGDTDSTPSVPPYHTLCYIMKL